MDAAGYLAVIPDYDEAAPIRDVAERTLRQVDALTVLDDGRAASRCRPCPLLVKYVEAGWLGRKAGRGFYDYRGEKPVPTR